MAKRNPLIDRRHGTGLTQERPLQKRSKDALKRHLAAQRAAAGYVNPRETQTAEAPGQPDTDLDALLAMMDEVDYDEATEAQPDD